MRNKILIIAKIILSIVLFLIWFIILQGEYEMIVKPELQKDFPIIKGVCAVYLTGFVLLVITAVIFFLLYSIKKSKFQPK